MDKIRILVVDDEQDIREILQFNLENEGFLVDQADSAEEALRMFTDEYSLVLLDIMMSGMSGFRMAERMRKDGIVIPIIFLTAKDTENDMLTGFSIRADDYISKPFSVKEVLARVKAVLKRTQKEEITELFTDHIEIGPFSINLETKQAQVNGESIILTKKELEILYLLMKHPGRVFSRQEILDKVWKEDSYVLDRTVDVHITRLRKKLGDNSSYISNRSGYGYCLNLNEFHTTFKI